MRVVWAMSRTALAFAAPCDPATVPALMPSGIVCDFERWLGHPDWFRAGTSLSPYPEPIPALISIADDLQILANLIANDKAGFICERIATSQRLPFTARWNSTIGLAPTVGEAIALIVEEVPRRNPFLLVELGAVESHATITLRVRIESPASPLLMIAPLLFLHRLALLEIGAEAAVGACFIECACEPQPWAEPALSQAGLAVRWRMGETRLYLPIGWMAHRNRDADPLLWDLARVRLSPAAAPESLVADAVAAHVRDCLARGDGAPGLPDSAAHLGLSDRTLVRRLAAAGRHHSGIVESERRQLAMRLMAQPQLGLQEIAEALGYPDRGSFGRAFRKSIGESPARYRRRHFGKPPNLA